MKAWIIILWSFLNSTIIFSASNDSIYIKNKDELKNIRTIVLNNKKAKILTFESGMFIGKIPDEIQELKELEIVNLTCEDITFLPEYFGQFKRLKKIDLGCNSLDFRQVIEVLKHCKELETCSLYGNQIKEIPKDIKYLYSLKSLNLSINKIEKLPAELKELVNLQKLNLSYNPINLDSNFIYITSLRNLQKLNLYACILSKLPQSIGKLKNLTYLDISNTGIKEINDYIGDLKNLEIFHCHTNSIKKLPDSLKKLKKLRQIVVLVGKEEQDRVKKILPNCSVY